MIAYMSNSTSYVSVKNKLKQHYLKFNNLSKHAIGDATSLFPPSPYLMNNRAGNEFDDHK